MDKPNGDGSWHYLSWCGGLILLGGYSNWPTKLPITQHLFTKTHGNRPVRVLNAYTLHDADSYFQLLIIYYHLHFHFELYVDHIVFRGVSGPELNQMLPYLNLNPIKFTYENSIWI